MKPFFLAILPALSIALAAEMVLTQPKELAAQLAAKAAPPAIFHVGPNLLYRGKHIPGSIHAGPASRPEGLEALRQAAAKLPHDRQIVLYCGCCPWDNCPNIKPAVELLLQMGFTRVKVLFIPVNFAKDWIDQGYPVEAGTAKR
ncbi:MAG: rhodanese-like domain-containing protein [Bryobacteraceae bacterium]|jgi:rhodanese-related sulfurtransferase